MYRADANKGTLKKAFQSTQQGDIINWFFWHQFPLLNGPLESTSVLIRNGFRISGSFLCYISCIPVKNSFIHLASFPKTMFQNEAKCESFDMKMFFFTLVQLKLIFTWTVLHSALFWKWELLELGYGLIGYGIKFSLSETRRVSLSRKLVTKWCITFSYIQVLMKIYGKSLTHVVV